MLSRFHTAENGLMRLAGFGGGRGNVSLARAYGKRKRGSGDWSSRVLVMCMGKDYCLRC